MLSKIKRQVELLKVDGFLFKIFLLHLGLVFLHVYYSFYAEEKIQAYIRGGFCFFISVMAFCFQRKGLSIGMILYSCVLLYINRFFNYTSFFFVLFAVYCMPKYKTPALILYAVNCFVSLTVRHMQIPTLGIHAVNCCLIYMYAHYIFKPKIPRVLVLTDDERHILGELADGKLQKEIEDYAPNTVTRKIRDAMERNLCKTKAELLQKFIEQKENESQG